MFEFEDQAFFKANADSIIRKKVALLQKNNVLQNLSVDDITAVANSFNQDLPEEYRINISVNDGKLVIPKEKNKSKSCLDF